MDQPAGVLGPIRPTLCDELATSLKNIARLDHPSLLRITSSGRLDSGSAYVVTEEAGAKDLAWALERVEALPEARVVDIALDLAGVLATIHAHGVICVDLSPSNIRYSTDDTGAQLAGTFFEAPFTSSAPFASAPEYWSPEGAARLPLDARSNIYSLGVILYECLCGSTPFGSHSYSDVIAQHLYREPSSVIPPAPLPPVSKRFQALVKRCLRKDPGERFQTAVDLRAALLESRRGLERG